MTADIEQRLRETSEHCFNCYQKWLDNKKDGALRSALEDAVHELRKTASRIEIELAVGDSSGSRNTMKPPANRHAKKKSGEKQKPQEAPAEEPKEAPKKVVLNKRSASEE